MAVPQKEKSLIRKLTEMGVSEQKARFILFLEGQVDDDWVTLSDKYFSNLTLDHCKKEYLVQENVQKAYKYLLKILHKKKMIELYNIYYEKAKDDTTAFTAFIKFCDTYFADDKQNELDVLLNGVDLNV